MGLLLLSLRIRKAKRLWGKKTWRWPWEAVQTEKSAGRSFLRGWKCSRQNTSFTRTRKMLHISSSDFLLACGAACRIPKKKHVPRPWWNAPSAPAVGWAPRRVLGDLTTSGHGRLETKNGLSWLHCSPGLLPSSCATAHRTGSPKLCRMLKRNFLQPLQNGTRSWIPGSEAAGNSRSTCDIPEGGCANTFL